jgi:hypothetical protein
MLCSLLYSIYRTNLVSVCLRERLQVHRRPCVVDRRQEFVKRKTSWVSLFRPTFYPIHPALKKHTRSCLVRRTLLRLLIAVVRMGGRRLTVCSAGLPHLASPTCHPFLQQKPLPPLPPDLPLDELPSPPAPPRPRPPSPRRSLRRPLRPRRARRPSLLLRSLRPATRSSRSRWTLRRPPRRPSRRLERPLVSSERGASADLGEARPLALLEQRS